MKIFSDRTPLALVLFGVVLVIYIGFLLVSNYLSRADLEKTAFDLLRYDTEKCAATVDNFFAERRSDLRNLTASRAFEAFFENRALGMTMKYGLRASLVSISSRLYRVIEERKINGDRIYTRIVFVDDKGAPLVDSSIDGHKYDWKMFLAPQDKDATIISEDAGKSLKIISSIPYFFKNRYAGQIIAWISPDLVYNHFIKSGGVSSKRIVYIDCGKGHLYLPADIRSRETFSGLFDPGKVGIREVYRFDAADKKMLATRVPVRDTPFSLIIVLPELEVFGHTAPWHLFLVMGALSVIILGGSVFVLRINNRRLILQARFSEASKQKHEIEEKNIQLEREIAKRRHAEEELKNYSRNLESMVEERTAELQKTLADLQNTQSQLIQSEKMSSVGQLAAGVAHEINNPAGFVKSNLGTINEYCEDLMRLLDRYRILEASMGNDEEINGKKTIEETLNKIRAVKDEIDLNFIQDDIMNLIEECREGTERIIKIVLDLKYFAHPGEDKMKGTDINKGIESTLNVVWNELKYKATVKKEYGVLPLVKCYPQQLNQAFMNILVNAAQAIEEHGEIIISTRADNDGYVEIKISDTGMGIPGENLSKLFDPFFTTKEVGEGTGLGLNIVYNIIQKHKGTIDVESKVGKGTTFRIRIPVQLRG